MNLASKFKIKISALLFLLVCFQTAKSQDTLSPDALEALLQKAERESQNYSRVFQNLSAEETKTKIFFKKNGAIDEKLVIKSIFVVYQSPNLESAQEFRNVIEFNGKNVTRNEKETAKFFATLAKAANSEEEYLKIRNESLRYDGKRISWGVTLQQPRPFSKNLSSSFEFKVVGKDRIKGRDVWIIEYKQAKPSPYILSNPLPTEPQEKSATQYDLPISNALRPTNPLMNGTIYLDAETGQIWRNQFKIILHPSKLSRPLETSEFVYEYQPSRFGILTPKKFIIRAFGVEGTDDRSLRIYKDAEIVYEYDKFSEFKAETQKYKTTN